MKPVMLICLLGIWAWLATSSEALAQAAQSNISAADIFSRNNASVVTISTDAGFGSGVLIDTSGVIVTNLHVVRDTLKVAVKLSNGDIYDDVAVIDFDNRKDLILLKIKGFKLPTVEIGDSDGVRIGDQVFAIGAPQGLENTFSEGIVSSLRDTGDGYRKLPRQVDTAKRDCAVDVGLGRNVSGGTRPRLSWGRSLL